MAGRGKVVDAEIVEGEEEIDPTDLRSLFFRPLKLNEEKRQAVEADLKALFKDSEDTRGDLDTLLSHWNDMAEGISPPKNFPWPDSCNIHVPIAETKLNELHSASRQTLLRKDGQVFTLESVGDPLAPQSVAKGEQYLNYKVTTHLGLLAKCSEAVWAAGRDGTALANVYYHEEYKTLPSIKTYRGLQEFLSAYPDVESSGLTKAQYQKVLDKFARGAKVVRLLEEEETCVYRGPKVDVVELQDFRMSPMTAIKTSHARLVGKIFTLRAPEIRAMAEQEGWDQDAVERVIDSTDEGRKDMGTQIKNEIEGIAKSHLQKQTDNGEFLLFNGIYRADLNDDGKEETYLVFFHYLSGALLGGVHYPYIHGHDNFVPVRIKKRPNRFLGRGLVQMLDDTNLEINTQHRQRIDSRTITTVPSFKAKNTERQNFDPTRPDKRFFPGVCFYLTDMNAVEQFKIEQTDMAESLQEESNLMALIDRQVGSMTPNTSARDAAAKVRMMVSLADARMDDYFEELAGNGEEGEGLDEVGYQILSILHQFADDEEVFPLFDAPAAQGPTLAPAPQPGLVPGAPAAPAPGGTPLPGAAAAPGIASAPGLGGGPGPLAVPGNVPMQPLPDQQKPQYKQTITAEELDAMQRRVKVKLAKTSTALNPDNALTRWSQIYSLLVMDPLVGGNPKGRLALDRRLLELARVPNPEEFLPATPQDAAGIMQMQQALLQGMMARKGGRPGARTRGQGKQPSAGGAMAGQGGGPK